MKHWSASALSAMLTAFLILCSFGVPASAHKYIEAHKGATRQDPIEIPNHRISHAAYGVLTEEGQTDYFRFTAKKGDSIVAEMLIPDIPRMKEFTPAISLYEPGSSSPSVTQLWIGGEPERFYEPFTQTQYLRRQRLRTVASADGEYLISVHSPNGQTGKLRADDWRRRPVWTKGRTHLPLCMVESAHVRRERGIHCYHSLCRTAAGCLPGIQGGAADRMSPIRVA